MADYHLSAEQQVVNDSYGVNAGAALGGVHGIVIPNLSFPFSEAQQQQLNLVPTTDGKLLNALMYFYLSIAMNGSFKNGSLPAGQMGVEEHYKTQYVWVSDDEMATLADISLHVLGSDASEPEKYGGSDIYTLRTAVARQQQNNAHAEPAAVNVNAIESMPGPSR